jgi:hypothetical protein
MPVRHVALPGLVGQIRLEAHPARARTLFGAGGPRSHDGAGSGGWSKEPAPRPPLAQVPGDGPSSGVEAVFGQALAPGHDLVLEHGRGEVGRHLGPSLARHQGPLTPLALEGDVALHPGLGAPRGQRHGPHRAPLDEHGVDAVFGQIHRTASERVSQNC